MIPVLAIPCLNRFDLLKRCIDSIDFPVAKLLIINNSGDHEYIPPNINVKDLYVWRMPTNLGVATSWNLAIKSTPHASGWVLTNNDAWFAPGALQNFWSTCDPNEIQLSGTPGWANVWVGRGVVEKVGLFSECYTNAYMEDVDYAKRADAAGVTVCVSDAVVHHDNSSTINSDPNLKVLNGKSHTANARLHDQRWADGVPGEGNWDLLRRCEYGFD